jgi:ABC-type Fe3+-hydroxamate transport system substrate-binding protein
VRLLRSSLPFLGIAFAALLAAGACGSTGSVAPSGSAATPPASTAAPVSPAASTEPSAGVSDGASASVVALPEACITAIRDYLIAIEPIVSGVDWRAAREVPPQIADQLEAAAFDPDVCPDVSAAEARDAWAAIATDVAPGALDYIDFIYRP